MRQFSSRILFPLFLLALVLVGCAQIEVAPADLDRNERSGVPFYLQRPYFALKEEIPVAGDSGVLTGVVQEHGMIKLLNPPARLRELLNESAIISLSSVALDDSQPGNGDDRSKGLQGQGTSGSEGGLSPKKKTGQTSESSRAGALTTATGDVSWDSSVPQSLPINSVFDVVYLPDLDEKYVISAEAGLGQAELGVAMGPGGTLNKFAMSVDNRELGKLVADTINKFSDVAVKAIDPSKGLVGEGTSGAEKAGFRVGQHVAIRYAYVIYATPGLYPILKNEEMRHEAYEAEAKAKGIGRPDPDDRYVLKARYPHTRISFNVRRVLRIAALAPNRERKDQNLDQPGTRNEADADWNALDTAIEPYLNPGSASAKADLREILEKEADYDGVKAMLARCTRNKTKGYVIYMKVISGSSDKHSNVTSGVRKKVIDFLLEQPDVTDKAKDLLKAEQKKPQYIRCKIDPS